MRKRLSTIKSDGDEDDASVQTIEFKVDPEMLTKLKVPKRMEQRTSFDHEMIYRYQMERDLKQMVEKYGSIRDRDKDYLAARQADPSYQVVATDRPLGKEGKLEQVNAVIADQSWRATSQPL